MDPVRLESGAHAAADRTVTRTVSLGKWQRLDQLANPRGHFDILAIDHRDSLRQFMRPDDPDSIAAEEIVNIKLDLIKRLEGHMSGVMLEPEYSIGPVMLNGALPPNVGFTAAIEAQGYLADPSTTHTSVLPGWSVEQAIGSGASAAKLLALWDPDDPQACTAQQEVIEDTIARCERLDLPVFLEPILQTHQDDVGAITEMVSHMASLGPDVLKLGVGFMPSKEAWDDACTRMAEATDGLPWVLLSAGVPHETYALQMMTACRVGASGFMVGRALWGDYLTAPDQTEFTMRTMIPRFKQLQTITYEWGIPWHKHFEPPTPIVVKADATKE